MYRKKRDKESRGGKKFKDKKESKIERKKNDHVKMYLKNMDRAKHEKFELELDKG